MGGFTKSTVPIQLKVNATGSQLESELFTDWILHGKLQLGSVKVELDKVHVGSSVKVAVTLQFVVPSPRIPLML